MRCIIDYCDKKFSTFEQKIYACAYNGCLDELKYYLQIYMNCCDYDVHLVDTSLGKMFALGDVGKYSISSIVSMCLTCAVSGCKSNVVKFILSLKPDFIDYCRIASCMYVLRMIANENIGHERNIINRLLLTHSEHYARERAINDPEFIFDHSHLIQEIIDMFADIELRYGMNVYRIIYDHKLELIMNGMFDEKTPCSYLQMDTYNLISNYVMDSIVDKPKREYAISIQRQFEDIFTWSR